MPIGVGTIFPNMSFLDSARFRSFRVWHPRGVDRIEVHSWCIVDKALPAELKAAVRRQYSLAFGPGGIFEQDDGDIWQSVQDALRGHIGRQGRFNYRMGLGREAPTAERYGPPFPGSCSDILMTEANQRAFYRHYASADVGADAVSRRLVAASDRRGPHDRPALRRVAVAEVEAFYRARGRAAAGSPLPRMAGADGPRRSRYRVPVTTSTLDGLVTREDELGYYDEDLELLKARVAKLESKQSWVEQPPSRLRYFVQVIESHAPTTTPSSPAATCCCCSTAGTWSSSSAASAPTRWSPAATAAGCASDASCSTGRSSASRA